MTLAEGRHVGRLGVGCFDRGEVEALAIPEPLAALPAAFSAVREPGGAPRGDCQEPQTGRDG